METEQGENEAFYCIYKILTVIEYVLHSEERLCKNIRSNPSGQAEGWQIPTCQYFLPSIIGIWKHLWQLRTFLNIIQRHFSSPFSEKRRPLPDYQGSKVQTLEGPNVSPILSHTMGYHCEILFYSQIICRRYTCRYMYRLSSQDQYLITDHVSNKGLLSSNFMKNSRYWGIKMLIKNNNQSNQSNAIY